jgi:hypothetical protein
MEEKRINNLLNLLDNTISKFTKKRLPLFSAIYSIFITDGIFEVIKTLPKFFQHTTNPAIVKKEDITNIINNISKILGYVVITGGSAHIIYNMKEVKTNDIDTVPLNYKSSIKEKDLNKLKSLGFKINYKTIKNTCLKDIKTGIDIDIQNTSQGICYRPGINFSNEEDLKNNSNKIEELWVAKPKVLILLNLQAIIYSNKLYTESKLSSRLDWLVKQYYKNFDNFIKEEKEFLEKHCTQELLSNIYKYKYTEYTKNNITSLLRLNWNPIKVKNK